jgi:hypothetical protein
MDKRRLTAVFNRGFRLGANDRASRGLPLSKRTSPPEAIPACPENSGDLSRQIAWTMGYATGYQLGASDSELACGDPAEGHGLLSEMTEQMLERAGAFDKMASGI